jgi:hypothetical protein
MEATAASAIESFLPSERAFNERCENDVFKASNKFTTMLMNYNYTKESLQLAIV